MAYDFKFPWRTRRSRSSSATPARHSGHTSTPAKASATASGFHGLSSAHVPTVRQATTSLKLPRASVPSQKSDWAKVGIRDVLESDLWWPSLSDPTFAPRIRSLPSLLWSHRPLCSQTQDTNKASFWPLFLWMKYSFISKLRVGRRGVSWRSTWQFHGCDGKHAVKAHKSSVT